MKIRSLALSAVAVGALGISGCGGSDTASTGGGGGSSTDAKALLAKTFNPTGNESKIKSGAIEFKIDGDLTGSTEAHGEATANIKLNEAKSGEIPEFSAAVKANGEIKGGQKINLDAGGVYTDNRFYVSYDGTDYDVGQELSKRAVDSLKQAIKESGSADSADQKQLIGKLGLDPQTWLTDPKVEGTESIGGTDTYKITGAVDIKALVPDILDAAKKAQSLTPGTAAKAVPEITDAQLDQAAKQIKKLDVTIWTGKDDTILRQLKVDLEVTGAKASDKVSGSLQLTLTDVNEPQDIKAPTNTKPVTDLIPKLNGLFGAAAGGSAAATTTTPNSQVSQAYIDCVNKAGNDTAKLNACQSELTK
jgi:hypothetical protein